MTKKNWEIFQFLLLIVITANSNAKITTVDDQFKLDLPLNHTYLNLERIDSVNELFNAAKKIDTSLA